MGLCVHRVLACQGKCVTGMVPAWMVNQGMAPVCVRRATRGLRVRNALMRRPTVNAAAQCAIVCMESVIRVRMEMANVTVNHHIQDQGVTKLRLPVQTAVHSHTVKERVQVLSANAFHLMQRLDASV